MGVGGEADARCGQVRVHAERLLHDDEVGRGDGVAVGRVAAREGEPDPRIGHGVAGDELHQDGLELIARLAHGQAHARRGRLEPIEVIVEEDGTSTVELQEVEDPVAALDGKIVDAQGSALASDEAVVDVDELLVIHG